jgi:glutathione S-transferase
MSTLKLYEHEVSGNANKVRLFLSLLGLPFTTERVDLFNGAGQKPDFLAISALGQVPALVDGDDPLRDSQAILFYLARKYGQGRWISTIRSARHGRSPGYRSRRTNWRMDRPLFVWPCGSSAPSTLLGPPS